MKASYLGAMGYSQRHKFPATWPIPPSYDDPPTSVQSYQEGIGECEFAEEVGFDWISFSEHHYSGRIATGTPAVMAAAVAERGGGWAFRQGGPKKTSISTKKNGVQILPE